MSLRYEDFKLDASGIKIDHNGFLKIPKVNATRVGIRKYTRSDGKVIKELRPEEEVFKADSLETLKLVPINIEHMVDGKPGLVKPSNASRNSVGSTGEKLDRDGDFVVMPISVTDEKGINAIQKDGKDNISAAYECEVDWTEGTYKGERYDCVQRDIVYNGLTLTAKGRMEGCRIRLDSGDAILADEGESPKPNQHKEEIAMLIEKKIPAVQVGETKLDSAKVQVPKEQEAAFDDAITRIDLANDEISTMQAKLDSLTGELKEAKENSEKFDSYIAPSEIMAKVKEQAALIHVAKEFKLDKAEELEGDDIKKQVLAKFTEFDKERLDSDSAYRDAAFDQVKSKMKKTTEAKSVDPASWSSDPSNAEAEAKKELQFN
jgi:hypothetical protein